MVCLAQIPGSLFSAAFIVLGSCYALGCVTLGYYLVWLARGQDVRQLGSRSVGARNVGRALGSWAFAMTLAWDMGKGALAVWGAERVHSSDTLKYLAMLAVVTGHIWPVQLRFRGGKGMATAIGAVIILNPWVMVGLVAVFIGLAAFLRNATLAGLVAFASLPLISGLLGNPVLETFGFAILTAVVLFAHRENIRDELAAWAAARKSRTGLRRSHEKSL